MTTNDDDRGAWDRVRETYNVPGEAPREAMWDAIAGRIGPMRGEDHAAASFDGPAAEEGDRAPVREDRELAAEAGTLSGTEPGGAVIDLGAERAARDRASSPALRRLAGWSVAAAALLVLGMGIGRMTAPVGPVSDGAPAQVAASDGSGIGLAAAEHLGRTESLLTMVRADARDGRVDPGVARWAEDLLAQTRLLLDRREGVDTELRDLLLDLELVLVQVVGVAEPGSVDDARARTEVELTMRSLEEGEVLPRIQATLPMTMSGA